MYWIINVNLCITLYLTFLYFVKLFYKNIVELFTFYLSFRLLIEWFLLFSTLEKEVIEKKIVSDQKIFIFKSSLQLVERIEKKKDLNITSNIAYNIKYQNFVYTDCSKERFSTLPHNLNRN